MTLSKSRMIDSLSFARIHQRMKARMRMTLTIETRGFSFIFIGPQSHLNHKLLSTILAPFQVGLGGGSTSDRTTGELIAWERGGRCRVRQCRVRQCREFVQPQVSERICRTQQILHTYKLKRPLLVKQFVSWG